MKIFSPPCFFRFRRRKTIPVHGETIYETIYGEWQAMKRNAKIKATLRRQIANATQSGEDFSFTHSQLHDAQLTNGKDRSINRKSTICFPPTLRVLFFHRSLHRSILFHACFILHAGLLLPRMPPLSFRRKTIMLTKKKTLQAPQPTCIRLSLHRSQARIRRFVERSRCRLHLCRTCRAA